MSILINKFESTLRAAEANIKVWKDQYDRYGDDAAYRSYGRALFAAATVYANCATHAEVLGAEVLEKVGPWYERAAEIQNELTSLDRLHLEKKYRSSK